MTRLLRDLPVERQMKVLWLHQVAFGEKEGNPCVKCKGHCCSGCAATGGYLRQDLPKKEWDFLAEAYRFDHNIGSKRGKGFLTEKGCALPPELRSKICLTFLCGVSPAGEKFSKDSIEAANEMSNTFWDKT